MGLSLAGYISYVQFFVETIEFNLFIYVLIIGSDCQNLHDIFVLHVKILITIFVHMFFSSISRTTIE